MLADEVTRLAKRRLDTVLEQADAFVRHHNNSKQLTLAALNIQSLHAHVHDLEEDAVLKQACVLALSESWSNKPISIRGFQSVVHSKRPDCRCAGVAIYKNTAMCSFSTGGVALRQPPHAEEAHVSSPIGDVCVAHINYNARDITFAAIYLSPEAQKESVKSFLSTSLGNYATTDVIPRSSNSAERSMPLIIAGDINVDVSKPNNACFTQYMKDVFDVHRVSQDLTPTTRNGSVIDHFFIRDIHYFQLANGALNPSSQTVYHWHNVWREVHFGGRDIDPLLNLEEKALRSSSNDKSQLGKLALGDKCPHKQFFEAFSGEEKLPGGASNGVEELSSRQASQLADWAERVPDFKPPVLDQDSPVEQPTDEIQLPSKTTP
ncbi:hypothetical protein HPB50_002442 [Hyalomma asiaticum]|uniref:Uncharacterized protein n=1 Tax=Hyalomma asiaticum TaxID=266040 RepID=A0ACB7SAW6_HYAAI|nr:hypothetical protein HPB50_002442 [Hyalomma asiaticum]